MKKFIAIVIAAVISMSLFGCSAADKVAEPDTPAEVDATQFPDAWEFDVYTWPTYGIATTIPTPMWSNRGEIYYDSEDKFSCSVGYATAEDFSNYVNACREAGYTANYFNIPGEVYYGENAEGQGVAVAYSEYAYYVEIQTAFDTSDWFKWWE